MSVALATGPSLDVILAAAAVGCGVRASEILSRSVRSEVTETRAIAIHVARRLTGLSLQGIGDRIGRDHSTVLAADRRIEDRSNDSRVFRALVQAVMDAARTGDVPAEALAASRAALREIAEAAALAADRTQPARVVPIRSDRAPSPEAAALRTAAEAAAEAWRACRQAEFTLHEKAARQFFESAMTALEATLKRSR
jgi:hypothetical protein